MMEFVQGSILERCTRLEIGSGLALTQDAAGQAKLDLSGALGITEAYADTRYGRLAFANTWSAVNLFNPGTLTAAANYSPSHTVDGLFHANAVPGFVMTTPGGGNRKLIFGYQDNAGGQYVPAIGILAESTGFADMAVFRTKRSADAFSRFQMGHSGWISWGGGAGAVDTQLERLSSGTGLQLTGQLQASGGGRFTGWFAGAAILGLGAELGVSAGESYLYSYNRTAGTYGAMNIQGTFLRLIGNSEISTSGNIQAAANTIFYTATGHLYARAFDELRLGGGNVDTVGVVNNTGLRLTMPAGVISPGTASTYPLRFSLAGVDQLTLGADATNAYIQSFASKPLYLNQQGNTVRIGNTLILNAAQVLYFDGGGNTYIQESSSDVLTLVTGGTSALVVAASGITAAGTVQGTTLNATSGVRAGLGSNGYVRLAAGDTGNKGYVEWYTPVGVRQGYMGFGLAGINVQMEVGNFTLQGSQVLSAANAETYINVTRSWQALQSFDVGPVWTTSGWGRNARVPQAGMFEFAGTGRQYGLGNSLGILYGMTAVGETSGDTPGYWMIVTNLAVAFPSTVTIGSASADNVLRTQTANGNIHNTWYDASNTAKWGTYLGNGGIDLAFYSYNSATARLVLYQSGAGWMNGLWKVGSSSAPGTPVTSGLDVMCGAGVNAFQVWDDNNLTTPRFRFERGGDFRMPYGRAYAIDYVIA